MSGRKTLARPKRSGEMFARTHQGDDEPSSKKLRFDARNPSTLAPDAPEEDAVLDLDEIDVGQHVRRNAVNIDGYDSDSDNDNFNARSEAKAKAQARAKKAEQEGDDDMFADLEEEDGDDDEELQVEGKKKKDVRFLDVDEIEGQVQNSKSGGHISADFGPGSAKAKDNGDTSSESGDDEERDYIDDDLKNRVGNDEDAFEVGAGGKKKHAPRVDAFNMRNENEEGKFDESGNFVRQAVDPDAKHDAWMQGLSKKDIKNAKEAQEKREEDRRQRELADDALLTYDLLGTLIQHLQKSETVLEALQRLNKGRPQKKKTSKWQKPKGPNDADTMEIANDKAAEDPAETKRREAVEAITGAADQLLTRGQTDIYDAERELLMRQYSREKGEDWVDAAPAAPEGANAGSTSGKQWEYRWADGRDGEERHGPYDAQTMVAWNDAGYFGEGVEFCAVGDGEWTRAAEFR
jgi:CD2 antigen cytoplasmic tail-binding protein 2